MIDISIQKVFILHKKRLYNFSINYEEKVQQRKYSYLNLTPTKTFLTAHVCIFERL